MITTLPNKSNTLLQINEESFSVNNNDLKPITPLLDSYNANPSEDVLNEILNEIKKAQDVNRYEHVLGDLIKHYVNKNLFYFTDDAVNQFPIPEDVVALLELVSENGGNINPLVNNIKLLRRNRAYSPEFLIEYVNVILKAFSDTKIFNSFRDQGYYSEVAYIQSKKPVFTLTEDGLIVAYKTVSFKDYKFDTTTGDIIPRYPTTYDEETGEPIVEYPACAEEYKIFFDSGKTDRMKTLNESNKYISIGSVVDRRAGQPGFEEDSILAFKGTKIADKELHVKVLIHPQFITRVDDKYDKIMTAVVLPVEFSKAPSTTDVKTATLFEYANKDWKAKMKKAKESVVQATADANAIIASQEQM